MRFLLLTLFCFLSAISFSQFNDCADAEIICGNDDIVFNPDGAGLDDFADPDNDAGCIVALESNSAWYYFEIDQLAPIGLQLGFTISPNGGVGEDYDWAVYGPNVDCGNLGSPFRCSSASAMCDFCPETGVGMGATDLSEGPGVGDGFTALMDVQPGQGFYLLIDNWAGTNNGFMMTWTGNGAQWLDCNAVPPCALSAEAGDDITGCEDGNSFVLNGSSGGNNGSETYSWSGTNGGTAFLDNPNSANPTVTLPPGFSGTIVYTLTVNEALCSGTDQVTVIINNAPSVTLSDAGPLCSDDTAIPLNANPTGGSWTGATGGWFDPVVTGPGIHTVTYEYTDANGCSNTASIMITVNSAPTVSINPSPANFCTNDGGILLTAVGAGGLPNYTYTWTTPNGMTVGSTHFATTTGLYVVNVTDDNNCNAIADINVTEFPNPLVTVIDPGSICESTTMYQMMAAPSGGTWSGANISPTGEVFPSIIGAGVYPITYTYSDFNNCSSSVNFDLVIIPPPSSEPSNLGPYCAGEAIELFGATNGTGVAITYSWTGPNGYTSSAQNPIDATEAGPYVLIVTIDGCESLPAITTVDASPSPDASATNEGPYCGGQSIQLNGSSTNTGTTVTYSWTGPNGYTSTMQNPTDATEAGNYELMITIDGCDSPISSTEVTFNTAPDAMASNSGPYCVGDNIELSSSTPNTGTTITYSWTGPNSYSSSVQNPTDATGAGIYTVIIDVDGCTSEPNETEITINTLPEPTITGDDAFCSGSSTIIDAGGPYDSYLWDDGTTLQTLDVNTNGTYFVTVTDNNGCTGVDQITINENQSPMPQIVGDASFCAGSSEVCTVPGQYVSYLWSDGSTGNSITVMVSGTVSVTVTDANGCTGENSVFIEELQNPTPTISGTDALCDGESTTLSTGTFETYVWSTGGNGPTIDVSDAGTYSVVVTNTDGCSGEAEFTVSVNDNPTPTITGNTSFCDGESSTLNAGDYDSYLWGDGSSNQTLEVTALGTYSVTVTTTNGCTGETEVNITVNPNPTPTIAGSTSFCAGNSTTLDAGTGYSSYSWSDGSSGQSLTVSTSGDIGVTVTDSNGCTGETSVSVTESTSLNPVISGDLEYCVGLNTTLDAGIGFETYEWSDGSSDQTLLVTGPGDYTVTVTDNGGCSGETSVSVIENSLPSVSITGNDPICTGESITLDAGTGFDNYNWSDLSLNQTISISDGGVYSVTVTDENGCTNEANTTVTENPLPEPIITGDQDFCSGQMVTLDAGAFNEYEWSDGSTNATLDISNGDTYTVLVTDVNGCTGSDQFTVTENQNPDPSILGDAEYCVGTMTTVSVGETFDIYNWSNGGTTQSIDVSTPGNIDLTVTDANGCTGSTNIEIIENQNPEPSISGSSTFCIGNSTVIDAGAGYIFYQWSDGTANQTLEVTTEGDYSVIVTDASGCTGQADISIIESQSLNPIIAGELNLCEGENSILDAGSGFDTYIWSNGEITQTIDVNTTNDYSVTVSDSQGCTGDNTVFLAVSPNPTVLIVGDEKFCEGDMASLDAGAGYDSYIWSNGETTQIIDVTTGNTYMVTVTNSGDCSAQTSFEISEIPNPTPSITGPNSFCTGNSVTLDAGPGFETYMWSNGETTQTVTLSSAIDIDVVVTNEDGCSGMDQISITENASLSPNILGDLDFCNGENSILDAGTGYETYEWSNGETTQMITVDEGNAYTVIVTDIDGCSGSDNVLVTEFLNPTPVIAGSSTFCTGGSSTLDAGNYISFDWSNGATTQTITVSTPGNYEVVVTDQNGCTATAFTSITESTSLNPVISGNLSFCENENTIIDAGAGFDTYLWSDGSMGQTLTVSNPDAYSVTVSDGQGCTGETTVQVDEIAPPTANVTSSISTCNTTAGGSVLNLYDLVTAGDQNGTWIDTDNSGAVGLFDNLNFNSIPAGDYNFVYTTNSATFPCGEISYPVLITIIDCSCPDVQFFMADPLCNDGGSLNLATIENTTEPGNWTITNTPPGSSPASITAGVFNATDSDIGSYTLQYTLTNPQPQGCPNDFNVTIDVDPVPNAGVAVNGNEFCQNTSQLLNLNSLLTGADANGSWTETSTIPSQFGAFDPVAGTFNTNFQDAGNYTFMYSVSSNNSCPDDFEEIEININPLPSVEIIETVVSLDCNNPTTTLDATGSSIGIDFEILWTGPGVVMDGNQNTLTPTVNQIGQYVLTITNTTTGCISNASALVEDDSDTPQAFAGDDQTIDCNFNNANLTASGDINAPFEILWTGPGIDVSNETNPNPNVTVPGIYTISITNPDNGCSSTDIVEVFEDITSPVIITQSALEELDCITPNADLISDSPTPGVSYEWFDAANTLVGSTATISGITTAGIYTVIVTGQNGCTNSETVEVIDNIDFPAANAGDPSLIDCINIEATLNGSGSETGADIVYLWTGPSINGAVDQSTSSANGPGTYNLLVTNTTNGCTDTDQVIIDENIDLPTVVVNQPTELDCTIETVTLDGTGSSTGNNFDYSWVDPSGTIISNTSATDVSAPGVYTLNILNTENGCSNSNTVLVNQNADLPSTAIIETYDPDCFGELTGFITVSDVIGGTAPYVYSLDGISYFNNPVFGNLPAGQYDLVIQDANGCELENTVTINPGATVSLDLGGDQQLELGDSVIVEAFVNIPTQMIDTIIWNSLAAVNCADSTCLEIGISTFNTIQVAATVIDTNGCTDYELITISMRKSRDVFIPNVFSPDGDGFNDLFMIHANGSQVLNIPTFRIFNRWGEVMFEASNILPNDNSTAWDGTFKGEAMNPGVYIYIAEIEFIDGRKQLYKGDLTLLK